MKSVKIMSAIIAIMCVRTCIYGCTRICMPTGAYIATKRDFAYMSAPYHAVTACKFSYGSVTVCGYLLCSLKILSDSVFIGPEIVGLAMAAPPT